MNIPIDITGRRISKAEQQELLQSGENREKENREKLIEGNLGLVVNVLHKYFSNEDDFQGLFSIGCIGLIKAVDRFDHTKGFEFSTFATSKIRGELQKYLQRKKERRSSRRHIEAIRQYYAFAKDGSEDVAEVCRRHNIDENLVREGLILNEKFSLNSKIFGDDEKEHIINLEVRDNFTSIFLDELLSNLSERNKNVLLLHKVSGYTQREVAEMYDMSQSSISKIVRNSIEKLQKIDEL